MAMCISPFSHSETRQNTQFIEAFLFINYSLKQFFYEEKTIKETHGLSL